MIIDCHGHYTTAPKELEAYRKSQIAGLENPALNPAVGPKISDDQIRESLENAQLKLQRERGTDLTIFSPRASTMAHHIGNAKTSAAWSRLCNDLIHRVCGLYPDNFVGVCMLPQSPGVKPETCIEELERCVDEFGFIGCNLNPDPSGGHWNIAEDAYRSLSAFVQQCWPVLEPGRALEWSWPLDLVCRTLERVTAVEIALSVPSTS